MSVRSSAGDAIAYLHSWSQSLRARGKEGVTQMSDAANLCGVGPGMADDQFAGTLSRLVGDRDVRTRSVSGSMKSGNATTRHPPREKILEVSDVFALPLTRPDTSVFKLCHSRRGQRRVNPLWSSEPPPEGMFQCYLPQ